MIGHAGDVPFGCPVLDGRATNRQRPQCRTDAHTSTLLLPKRSATRYHFSLQAQRNIGMMRIGRQSKTMFFRADRAGESTLAGGGQRDTDGRMGTRPRAQVPDLRIAHPLHPSPSGRVALLQEHTGWAAIRGVRYGGSPVRLLEHRGQVQDAEAVARGRRPSKWADAIASRQTILYPSGRRLEA